MQTDPRILEAIFAGIDDLNGTWPDLGLERTPEAVLLGPDSRLDSTSFVFLAVSIEQHLERLCGVAVALMDVVGNAATDRLTASDLAGRLRHQVGAVAERPADAVR
jgi:hypothetical protein